VSGWALSLGPDRFIKSGVVKSAIERRDACLYVKKRVQGRKAPLVVITERFTKGGWGSYLTLIGVGKSRGRWLEHLELILDLKEKHLLQVTPQAWRFHLYPAPVIKACARQKDRLKQLAVDYTGCESPDEAEARCLTVYAHTTEVGFDAAEAAERRRARALRQQAKQK
jgi:hypothetical protein